MRKTEKDVNPSDSGEDHVRDGQDADGSGNKILNGIRSVNSTIISGTNTAVGKTLDGTSAVMKGATKIAWNIGTFMYSLLDVIVGLCFLVLVGFSLYYSYTYDIFGDYIWSDYTCLAIYTVGGLVMIFNPRRTFNRSIGTYALIMGSSRFVTAVASFEIGEGVVEDLIFTYYFVLALLGINLLYSGASYLRGKARGYTGMMINAVFLLALCLAEVIFDLRMGVYDSLSAYLKDSPETMVEIILYFLLLIMLDTREARLCNGIEHFTTSLDSIRRSKSTDSSAYVLYDEAKILCDASMEKWRRVGDGGPVEFECKTTVHGKDGDSVLIVQKWDSFDGLYCTLADHSDGTLIRATRFSAYGVYMSDDCTHIFFLGPDHFYININVRVPLREYSNGEVVA